MAVMRPLAGVGFTARMAHLCRSTTKKPQQRLLQLPLAVRTPAIGLIEPLGRAGDARRLRRA